MSPMKEYNERSIDKVWPGTTKKMVGRGVAERVGEPAVDGTEEVRERPFVAVPVGPRTAVELSVTAKITSCRSNDTVRPPAIVLLMVAMIVCG